MTIYVPYYDFGRWQVAELPAEACRYRRHQLDGGASLEYRSMIYSGNHIYSDRLGAELYIAKEYGEARRHACNPWEVPAV